jgi:hypothetical protein
MKLFLFCLVLMFLIVPVNAVDWHDDSRLKRVQLNVNNSSVVLTDYQIMKNVTYDSDMQTDFDDLLFYNESGETVSYWIESKTDSNTADIWLKIPSISTTEGSKVWMYYDNSSASSASSGADTFIQWHGSTTSQYLKVLDLPVTNITCEWKLKWTNPIALQPSLTNLIGNTDDFYYIYYSSGAGLGSIGGAANENTASHTAWDTNIIAENTYHKFKIEVGVSSAEYFTNGVSLGIVSTNLPNENLGLGVRVVSGSYEQEWALVRKYTATEPIWGADGEEESYEAPPPALNGTYLYPNSTYSIGYYGRLTSELVYETGINLSDIDTFNLLTSGNMEYLSIDDTNYIPSIDKDAAHDGYMYGNFSLPNVKTVNFINVKTVHNRNFTNPVILGLFNVSTQKWHAVNNSSVETVDVELTYNITGTDIAKYSTLIDNTLNLSVSLNTNGDGNYDVFVDFVEVYIDYEEVPDITLGYVYNLTISNQNNISILQNDVDDLKDKVDNLYLFVLLCTAFLIAVWLKRRD